MYRSKITGVGMYVPKNVVTNHDLEKMMDTSDEWIRERSGIVERHWVDPDTSTSDLGVRAAEEAIKAAGIKKEEIDFIIAATLSPDYYFPGIGVLIGHKLGINGVGALDVRNQCTGFVYSLAVGDQFIRTGFYRKILIVGAEVHSKGLNKTTEGRDVAVLFGDGAGAVILEPSEDDEGIITSVLHGDGKHAKKLITESPGSATPEHVNLEMVKEGKFYPKMEGREVFKHAVVRFNEVILEVLQKAGLNKEDIALVIPHQANQRITEAIRQRLKLPPEKVMSNIHKYGNTTAASIPIALYEALQEGRIKKGDYIVLAAFGSGFTWGANLIKW